MDLVEKSTCQHLPPCHDGGIQDITGELILSFSRLMEAERRTTGLVCRTSKFGVAVRPSHPSTVKTTTRKRLIT